MNRSPPTAQQPGGRRHKAQIPNLPVVTLPLSWFAVALRRIFGGQRGKENIGGKCAGIRALPGRVDLRKSLHGVRLRFLDYGRKGGIIGAQTEFAANSREWMRMTCSKTPLG